MEVLDNKSNKHTRFDFKHTSIEEDNKIKYLKSSQSDREEILG
jgi:hypothetical protein